jgi:hypothetical protein
VFSSATDPGHGERLVRARVARYASFVGLATLSLAWLFDDRDRYRLRHVMNLSMPKASSESEET